MNTRLIARFLAGESDNTEEEKIDRWIKSNPKNRELMEEFGKIWEASGKNNDEFNDLFNPEDDWEELCGRIMRDYNKETDKFSAPVHRLNTKRSKFVKARFSQLVRIAAIILVASLLGVYAYQNLYQKPKVGEPTLREISMERGQQGNITLSDGTKVTLNSESKIILPNVFKPDKREITLKGEAFFDVAHNPDRPFIINTDDAVVQVLGTSLDVRSYPGDDAVQVVVKEGRVSLASKKEWANGDEDTILTAGERGQLLVFENRIATDKVDDLDLYIGWKEGFLKFKDTPMHEIAEELERKYDITITFNDKELEDLRLTAELKGRTIQHNMDVISTSLDMDYKMDQQIITFYKK